MRNSLLDKLSKLANPISLWRHNPSLDTSYEGLIEWTLQEQDTFKWDLVKVTATGTALCQPYDVETKVKDDEVGTTYVADTAYTHIDSLYDLPTSLPLNDVTEAWPIKAAIQVRKNVKDEIPVIATLFTPETMISKLTQGRNALWDQDAPAYRFALLYFREMLSRQVNYLADSGLDGVFLASQVANKDFAQSSSHKAKIERSERQAVAVACNSTAGCMYHIHGAAPHLSAFESMGELPAALHWHTDESALPFATLRRYVPNYFAGGIPRDLCASSYTNDQITDFVEPLITNRSDSLIAPSCTMHVNSDPQMFAHLKETVKGSSS